MRKYFYSSFLVLFLLSVFLPVLPARAAGASLYFSPSTGTHILNSKFTVSVKINSGGTSVNASQGSVSFDKSLLKVVGISKGSIFNLWTEEPNFSNSAGTISFGGGIPRPGYSGSGGTICTITFQAIKLGAAHVNFSSGDILANDGKGTNVLTSLGSASFTISPAAEAPKPVPGEAIKPITPPQDEAAYNKPAIVSETHPDQNKWYKEKDAKFTWKLPSDAQGVSILFDQKEYSVPASVPDGLFNSKEYAVTEDGHWYLHVKVKDAKGRWGTAGHYRVNIDSAPPKDFSIKFKQDDLNDWPSLEFSTSDELSGLDRYELIIDSLSATPIILTTDINSYKLSNLEVGEHTAAIKVFDHAENIALSTINFSITSALTPIIANYSKELSPSDKFFISGTASPDNIINVYIKENSQANPEAVSVKSDKEGNWFLVSEKEYANGQYLAWVEAINPNGLKSKQSAKVSFLVSPPVFTRIGSLVINYFTVLVSLLFIVVLIVFLLIWIFEVIRKKLKKETIEIEKVLEKNMEALKISVNEEIDALSKMTKIELTKSKAIIKGRLEARINETNGDILKEVKDVEKLLK
jgi:hypothetical protein